MLRQKIHKSFSSGSTPPLRPIVSSIDTYNYKIAQYLGSLLSPQTLQPKTVLLS